MLLKLYLYGIIFRIRSGPNFKLSVTYDTLMDVLISSSLAKGQQPLSHPISHLPGLVLATLF
jgi:hypothetical protein